MAHTYHELKKMTVAELREIAKEIPHDAVQGYSQMNKDHLLVAICKALNVAMMGMLSVFLDLTETSWKKAIQQNLPEKLHDINFKAFEAGQNAGRKEKSHA